MLKKLRKRKAVDPPSQVTETQPDKPIDKPLPPKRQESIKNMETHDRKKKTNEKRIAKVKHHSYEVYTPKAILHYMQLQKVRAQIPN